MWFMFAWTTASCGPAVCSSLCGLTSLFTNLSTVPALSEGAGAQEVGRLRVGRRHVARAGRCEAGAAVPAEEVASIGYTRSELPLSRRDAGAPHLGSLDAPGARLELVDSLKRAAQGA